MRFIGTHAQGMYRRLMSFVAGGRPASRFMVDTPKLRLAEEAVMQTYDRDLENYVSNGWPRDIALLHCNAWAWTTIFVCEYLRLNATGLHYKKPPYEVADAIYWFTDGGRLDPRDAARQYQLQTPPDWVDEAREKRWLLSTLAA